MMSAKYIIIHSHEQHPIFFLVGWKMSQKGWYYWGGYQFRGGIPISHNNIIGIKTLAVT